MIIETIVTTRGRDGAVNCAPMGVEWDEDTIVLKPFLETATYRNVAATGAAVVNLTDDVRVFAQAAISNPVYETAPAIVVDGVVLVGCCSWREVAVRAIDNTPPRARIDTAVVHRGMRREFVGFNRAAHRSSRRRSTRLACICCPGPSSSEARPAAVIVNKTAGPRELEAMSLLVDFIRSVPLALEQA
jgi:hypothetical protein